MSLLFLCHLLLLMMMMMKADSKCQKSYPCRDFTIEFPFTDIDSSECGLFPVDCSFERENPRVYLGARDFPMDLLKKVSNNKFLIYDQMLENYYNGNNCDSFGNVSLPKSPLVSFAFSPNLTSFSCWDSTSSDVQNQFVQYRILRCDIMTIYYKTTEGPIRYVPPGCTMTQMPLNSSDQGFAFAGGVSNVLTPNFTLEWHLSEGCYACHGRGGQCLTDDYNDFKCKQGAKVVLFAVNTRLKKILFIGGVTFAALTSTLIILFVLIRRKCAMAKQEQEKDIELFLKNNGNLAPMRYKYSTIKKRTNSFTENLGRGGFGSVFKGMFPDGRLVAVKVLNESNANGEDFMNEVASISRTSHVNIVSLLGFCFEGSKRALIYDFMPNGSLEKFIGNTVESGLGWDKLFEIALGIARGLEYLHQGCNTRILHLDIKPQNILLDKDLNPRISDFGLAKLCPNRSSIVSMMVARGTIGYIAPEVFSRNFGEVSYMSDVYSCGMLVLEMVGGRRAIDRREVDRTSEIYFPDYIYKQLEEDAVRDSVNVVTTGEGESQVVRRNLMIVGLWCIQTNPKDRPSMAKVVEMLEGKLGSLEVPPKPYLYSPPRSALTFSASESL